MNGMTRSIPYLRTGFALMCGAVLIWLLSAMYVFTSATADFNVDVAMPPDLGKRVGGMMRVATLANGLSAVLFLGGVVLTAMGLI